MAEDGLQLFLIRHAEDAATQMRKFDDLRLTVEGEDQARGIGNYLKQKGVTSIHSSPMKRTTQTSEIISAIVGVPVVSEGLLRDRDLGQASGLSYEQVQNKFSNVLSKSAFGIDFKFPDGESNGDVFDRSHAFLSDLLSKSSGTRETIAIISHPLILNYLMYLLQGINFKEGLLYSFEAGFGAHLSRTNTNYFQLLDFGKFY